MSKCLLVLCAGVLLQACGAAPESTEVEQGALRARPGEPDPVVCCREKFPAGPRRGQCVAEAAKGQGPCGSGHHPGGGKPPCKDAGGGKDATADAGRDAGNHCPSVLNVWVSTQTDPIGAQSGLSATIDDNGASVPITYDWHLVGPNVGNLLTDPTATNAAFVCTSLGTQIVELTITGGDPTATCTSSGSVTIDCTSLCGNATVDPGEGCDPPNAVTCDMTCNRINQCPVIASVVPTSPVINQFGTTIVTASASDPDPTDALTYAWSATAGSFFGATTGAAPSYWCNGIGVQTIRVTVSDGQCSVGGSTQVTCLAVCGNGVVEPGEQCDPPETGPDGLQCGPTCQYLTCGNGVIDPGEQCDPPLSGVCSATCQNVPPPNTCGDGVIDPGETCDPPDGTTCDQTCQTVVAVCGDGIVEPGEACDFGPTSPALCRNCAITNCGGCFVALAGGGGLCSGVAPADVQACSALVACTANNMGGCASSSGAYCYCTDTLFSPGHNPGYCANTPADGVCAAQFQALAHSNDPVVVMAQINDPTTTLGKIATAANKFAHSSCGPPCFVYNN